MQMLQHGASGYLLKNASSEELLKCIYEVLEDKIALSAEVTAIITRPQQSQLKQVFNLTKREKQVLSMIAAGQTSASIAAELYISPFTVETHRRNLMQKFDASNTATLIKMAVEQRLV
jgi:DNA-binding NarL/FixJ family response regulator